MVGTMRVRVEEFSVVAWTARSQYTLQGENVTKKIAEKQNEQASKQT